MEAIRDATTSRSGWSSTDYARLEQVVIALLLHIKCTAYLSSNERDCSPWPAVRVAL
jgi:hypothetical protein